MSKCCKAPVIVDEEKNLWCEQCNRLCEIDYESMEYVIKKRENEAYLIHFKCGNVTNRKDDILQKRCVHCNKYLK